MRWVIFGVKEEGEVGLATREGYDAQPVLQKTTDGTPCLIYDEFEAGTYEEATAVYEKYMGFGPRSGEG